MPLWLSPGPAATLPQRDDRVDRRPQLAVRLASGDFGRAWGGISSLQLGLPLAWTQASQRGFALHQVADWMAARPAALAGLRRKGGIAVGADADFCVLAPDEWFTVDPARLLHRHPVTPYADWRLRGVVRGSYLRGGRSIRYSR